MERIFEYQITAAEEGRKIGDFLREKGYSRHLLRQLKETEDGLLRNAQPTFTTVALKAGDRIRVRLLEKAEGSEAIMPAPLPFEIVYEDEDLLVVNKPANMPIHPSFQNHGNTLADALTWHYQQHGEDFVYRCIKPAGPGHHRPSHRRQTPALRLHPFRYGRKTGDIRREYLAIVKGIPPENGTISAPISRKKGSAILREVNFETGEPAVTHFARLEIRNGLSLVSLKLETGRTHQIRVHMGYIGCPLIGDYLYYPECSRISRQALHSHRLSFLHPITGKALSFTAPLPEDMKKAFWS